jgi:hypothetical protein
VLALAVGRKVLTCERTRLRLSMGSKSPTPF